MNKEEIKNVIKKSKIAYIRMQFTDMLGDIKAVEIPINRIDDALNNKIMFNNGFSMKINTSINVINNQILRATRLSSILAKNNV